VFINPTFDEPKERYFMSQHPYLADYVGGDYVCNYPAGDGAAAAECVKRALTRTPDLPPLVPSEMRRDAYLERIRAIFEPFFTS